MKLSVKVMEKSAAIDSILMFQTDKDSDYWRQPLFSIYPFLDERKGLKASWKNRKKYLTAQFSGYYGKIEPELHAKAEIFNHVWSEKQETVAKVFTDTFKIDCYSLLNDITVEVSLNPICPRDIGSHSFTVFYQSDETRFLETALHEIIHFAWFHLWQNHFKDDSREYDSPHLKWILSEMVVDTFVCNTQIGSLFSPTGRENAAYQCFYTMKIDDAPILETLSQIYQKSSDITQFMEQACNYCQKHEPAIRRQML